MASVSFALPANIAAFLNANVPGFAAASGGGDTVALQVPPFAVPAPVVAGLAEAGIQVPAEVAPPAAGTVVDVPAAVGGLAPIAPAVSVPQEAAAADATAGWQSLAGFGQAAEGFFQYAAANPPPANLSEFASWAAAQQQAVLDYFGGV